MPIPHSMFLSETPDRLARLHQQLVPFGISCFIHTVDEHPKKLADRAYLGFILGYGPSSQLYRVLIVDPPTGNLRFRLVRHLTVTVAHHKEYHARATPLFTMRKPARLCNVETCVEPVLTAVPWSAHVPEDSTIPPAPTLAAHMYPAPAPSAGVVLSLIHI